MGDRWSVLVGNADPNRPDPTSRFPCDHSSFIPLAASLAREPGVLVGVSCMPEYDHDVPLRPQGYDLDQIAACFAQAVAALQSYATRKGHTLTLVVHDWGIAPGFMHSNSLGCDKLVVFDVLIPNPKKDKPDKFYYPLNHLNYQSCFAIAFGLSRLSVWLAWVWTYASGFIVFGLLGRWLNPVTTPQVAR